MTVAELIAKLSLFPQGLEVRMSMNMEYEGAVEPHFLYVYDGKYTDKPILMIDDAAEGRNKMTTEIIKTGWGTEVHCYGVLADDSNFEVVCEEEDDDSCWTDGNPDDEELGFKTWTQVVETLNRYYDSDIVEITAC